MRSHYVAEHVERLEARIAALEQQIQVFLPETEVAAQPAEEEDAAALRGRCPCCGKAVLSRTAYVDGRGFIIFWACAGSEEQPPSCNYRKIL